MAHGQLDIGHPLHQPTRRRAIHLIAVAAMVALAGCAMRPGGATTAPPATATPRHASPTPAFTETSTRRIVSPTPTPTSPPATATLIPVSPTPTPSTSPPTPTPSPSPAAAEPAIHTFRANVDVADPGDAITLTWRWSGGRDATIYHLLPTGQLSTPSWDVEPAGSLQYTISPERRNHDTFALFVYDEDGVATQETVQVELRCPDAWFFSPAPDICPADAAIVTDGAQQPFEHGLMLWVEAEDRIYVLFGDEQHPRWSAYVDEWDEGEPTMDPDIEPPAGLQQPVRGFGLVWRERPTVRERLGWAVEQERGYETAVQRSSHYRYSDLYIRALDGGVWKLGPNGSAWEHLPPP